MVNWNTGNMNVKKTSTDNVSIWGTMKQNPVESDQNLIKISHVSKPVPVFTMMVPDYVNLNKYLKEVILKHRQNNPESTKSNVKAWHSSWQTHKENLDFKPFIDMVLNACNFISKGYFNTQDLKYEVFNCWAAMYEKGEYTIRHSHFPSELAVTYYVDVEEGCSPLVFEPVLKDNVNDNNKPLSIVPKNGMLVIWPAILHHAVPPTDSRRMVVAMNINKNL